MNKRKRAIVAFHEASHAVAARLPGIEVIGVVMFQTNSAHASVLSQSAAHHAGPNPEFLIAGIETDIRISLAGPVGDLLYGKRRAATLEGGDADDMVRSQSKAVEIALRIAGEPLPQLLPGESKEIEVSSATAERANVILRRLYDETKTLLTEMACG